MPIAKTLVALALVIAFVVPSFGAMVTLTGIGFYPTPPYQNFTVNEGISETAITMTLTGDTISFLFTSGPVTAVKIDQVGLMIDAVTTGDTLKVSVEGVTNATTAGGSVCDGVVNGATKTLAITTADVATWKWFPAGMAAGATNLVPGTPFCIKVAYDAFVAGNLSLNTLGLGGSSRAPFYHTARVLKNSTLQTGTLPRVGVKDSTGAVIYLTGNYPAQGTTSSTSARALDHYRFDPFYNFANTNTAGPNVITEVNGSTMTSTAHGLTVTRPFQRVRIFTGAQAGQVRIGMAIPDANTVTFDEPLSANIAPASSVTWHKALFAGEGGIKISALPFKLRVVGISWSGDFNTNSRQDFVIYGPDDQSVVGSVTGLFAGYHGNTSTGAYMFSTPVILRAGKRYRVMARSNTNSTGSFGVVTYSVVDATTMNAFDMGSNVLYSERLRLTSAQMGTPRTISDITSGVVTLSGALATTDQVIFNATNPSFSDYVQITAGPNATGAFDGTAIVCQITALASQSSFTIGNCNGTLVNDAVAGRTWTRIGAWQDRTLSRANIALIYDQISIGDDTGWFQ